MSKLKISSVKKPSKYILVTGAGLIIVIVGGPFAMLHIMNQRARAEAQAVASVYIPQAKKYLTDEG